MTLRDRPFHNHVAMVKASHRGQTLVEFALVLPVFLMLIFAVIDAGRGVLLYNILSNAARDGAHYEAIHTVASNGTGYYCNATQVTATQLTNAAMVSAGPYSSAITVSTPVTCTADTYGTYNEVQASATFQPLTTLVFGTSLNLSATSKSYIYTP